ncbi:MAG: hybrid sensor histidine kinase/response regulator [Ignavibacteriae bacterium]|nr:hybrid sensor histidine kinase/response regulator [Ignavibacteriota bacterium]
MEKQKINILIVDDEKGLRIGTQRLLEDEGYYVDVAENGTEGIKLGSSKDYDLAVIDLKMPDIEGIEVLREIKKVHPNTICFIATAFASYDTAIEATREGAFTYIPKPFSPEEILQNLEQGYKQRVLLQESDKLKKEREEKLLELANEKSRLNTIVKTIADGVLVINKSTEVVYYNYAAIKYLDLESIKIGEKILDKCPKKINDLVRSFIDSENKKQKSILKQIEIKPKGELFVECICSSVENPDGTFAGVVLVIRNITELKKIELIKSQFVSMVAHELKTPMAAVLGFLKIILDKSIPVSQDKLDEFLNRSVVRLKGLLDLVNDLLDISRMELQTKQREIIEINIEEIIDTTIQFLEIEIQKRNIEVTKEYQKNLPIIKADQNEIIRLFTNILSNAIKYNSENGKININICTTDNYLSVAIKDTGIGLKPEEKEKLYLEFYRAKNEKTRGISGTGLGLTIVKRIVDSYHGKIEVESEYGEGTNFKVFLPLNK